MITGNATVQLTAQTTIGNKNESISCKDPLRISISGSKMVDVNVPLTGSVFTSIMTGSISDFRYLYAFNTHTASSVTSSANWTAIIVASQSLITSSFIVGELGPKDSVFFSPRPNTTYFAKASGSGAQFVTLRVAGVERI